MTPPAGTIQIDQQGASDLANTLRSSLQGYLNFSLQSIGAISGVNGGYKHDGLQGGLKGALSAWSDLITSDANAVTAAFGVMKDADKAAAKELLGLVA